MHIFTRTRRPTIAMFYLKCVFCLYHIVSLPPDKKSWLRPWAMFVYIFINQKFIRLTRQILSLSSNVTTVTF